MTRFAILGNHLPRHRGIATFTTHLADGLATERPDADVFVLAVNDAGRRHTYHGAADTSVARATGSVSQLLDWLDRHGTPS